MVFERRMTQGLQVILGPGSERFSALVLRLLSLCIAAIAVLSIVKPGASERNPNGAVRSKG